MEVGWKTGNSPGMGTVLPGTFLPLRVGVLADHLGQTFLCLLCGTCSLAVPGPPSRDGGEFLLPYSYLLPGVFRELHCKMMVGPSLLCHVLTGLDMNEWSSGLSVFKRGL